MTTKVKNIIIIVLLSLLILIGLYNIIDLKAAYIQIQENFEEERNTDSVKHAELLLRGYLKDLRSQIASYDEQLEAQRINLAVEQAALAKSQELQQKRGVTKLDFANRIVEASDQSFEYFGQVYTPQAARDQLRYFIMLVQDMEAENLEKQARIENRAITIQELEDSIRLLKQQLGELEKEADRLINSKQVAEIQKISNDLAGTASGSVTSTPVSKITGEISNLFGLLEREIVRNTYVSPAQDTVLTAGNTNLLGFEQAESMQNLSLREQAIDAELTQLLETKPVEKP